MVTVRISTKFIGRLESAQDVDRVRDWFSQEGSPSWLAARKTAAAGSFIGRWPDMPDCFEGESLKSRALESLHESAWSPERVEQAMLNHPIRDAFEQMSDVATTLH